MSRLKLAVLFFSVLLILSFLTSCNSSGTKDVYRETKFLFHTEVFIEAYGKDAEKAVKEAIQKMAVIDQAANSYSENSEITQLNKASGKQPVALSEDLFNLLDYSLEIAEQTGGAFDPTVGPLVELWQTAELEQTLPSKEQIQETLQLVNYKNVIMNSDSLTAFLLQPGMSIDLGAITKGFAVEKGMAILKEHGISNAMIRAGGNVYTIGTKPDGSKWQIGIRDPLHPQRTIGYLEPIDQVVDTSGNYEQFFTLDDKSYGHIIDPHSGYPADKAASCTIITDRPALADALSTAALILGANEGLKLLERIPDTEGIMVSSDGQLFMSSGFGEILKFE